MNKRILSILIALSMCLALFPLPVTAIGTGVTAAYADGVVTMTGTGFTSGVSYTVRIVDTANPSIKAMGQVKADGSESISASITTGALGEVANYKVYVNNPDGTLAGSAASIQQTVKTYTVTTTASSNGSINPTAKTVNEGEHAVFTVTPNQGYEVDTVSAGIYDAESNTLTVYNVKSDLEVQITFKPINATAVALNENTATIEVNGSVALIATVQPENAKNKNVTWASSNSRIATVENGVVTGVKTGTAVITATTEDGGHRASCTVTVVNRIVEVTGIVLNRNTAHIKVGGTVKLTAMIQPGNATNKNVSWSCSDPNVATVENGVVTGIKAGTVVVTVTTVDGGFTATSSVLVRIKR